MKCELFADCKLFEEDMVQQYCHLSGVLEASQEKFKECCVKRYCNNSFKNCARYQVAKTLTREEIPATLLPSQNAIADKLISQTD